MKRIMNDVALQTVLYLVGGLQKVRIIDKDNWWYATEPTVKENDRVVFEGLYKDADIRDLERHTKITSIQTDNDTLVILICTKSDRY